MKGSKFAAQSRFEQRLREIPTRNKISHTRVLGSRWYMELVDETTTQVKDGDSIVATEICVVIPPPGDGSIYDRSLHLLVQVELADGRIFSRIKEGQHYGQSWITNDGTRLKELFCEIVEAEDFNSATYYLVAY